MTYPTPPLHDPSHPTPTWPMSPYMTHPTPSWSIPPLHDPFHPTPVWPTPPHPYMTHPTPPLYDPPHPTPPHPWYIFGYKGAFFHGLLHYVSLSVDKYTGLTIHAFSLYLYPRQIYLLCHLYDSKGVYFMRIWEEVAPSHKVMEPWKALHKWTFYDTRGTLYDTKSVERRYID